VRRDLGVDEDEHAELEINNGEKKKNTKGECRCP